MVTRLLRLLGIGLAVGAAPLALSACELLAGVHGVTLGGVAVGEMDGGGEAGDAHADVADGTGDADDAGDAGDAEGMEAAADAPSCGAHAGSTYYVDPRDGDDTIANGSMAAPCSFRTIRAALQYLGPTPAAGTIVAVLNTANIMAPQETFPIRVPLHVTIQGQPIAIVNAPTGASSVFTLSAPGSGLDHLDIDGRQVVDGGAVAGDVDAGIVVDPGSDATTFISNVRVEYMSAQGILVQPGGTVTLSGIFSASNGVPRAAGGFCPPPGDGLEVLGTAIISVVGGGTALECDNNANYGISVRGSGSLTVMETATATAHPAVIAANNYHGLVVMQTPTSGSLPENDISSLLVTHSLSHGIQVTSGSSLKLRGSATMWNGGNGVQIAPGQCPSGNFDVSSINLGTMLDPGENELQFPLDAGRNGGSGICLTVNGGPSQRLRAAGNIFDGASCASTAASLTHIEGQCGSGDDYGVVSTTKTLDLGQCQ